MDRRAFLGKLAGGAALASLTMGAGRGPGPSAPGLGVDIDEEAAARHPIRDDPPFDMGWGELRDVDGTIRRP